MNAYDELEALAVELEVALEQATTRLARQLPPDIPPTMAQDTSGRFILVDALVSLANVRTALLLRMPTPRPARTPPAGESGVSASTDGRR